MRALIKSIKEHNLLTGLGLLLLCLLGVFLAGQTSALECARPAGGTPNCILRITWMEMFTMREHQLTGLRSASLDENCDDEGCTYRIYLDAQGGGRPMTSAYSSGTISKNATIQKINQFAVNPNQTELAVEAGGKLWVLLPGVFLLGVVYWVTTSILAVIRDIQAAAH
jgi:hypothetical protein